MGGVGDGGVQVRVREAAARGAGGGRQAVIQKRSSRGFRTEV